jgi:nuclear GTP-binding protein
VFNNLGYILSKVETGPLMPKNAKSVEDLKTPMEVTKIIYNTIDHDILLEHYEVQEFENHMEFLENLAKQNKFLIKKGYPDVERAARYVIKDIIEGKIKYETSFEQ